MSRVSERDDATGDESSGMDFAAILRDEEFVESLLRGDYDDPASSGAARGSGPDSGEESGADEALADLFGAMRREIHGVPMPEAPTEDELAAALAGGGSGATEPETPVALDDRRRRRRRWMTTVTAGAASVAVLLGGIAVAGHYFGADVPAEQSTQEVVTAAQVSSDLDLARNLLDRGDRDACMAMIESTTERLDRLRGDPQFEELDGRRVRLWSQLTGRPESEAPEVGGSTDEEPSASATTVPESTAPESTSTLVPAPPVDTSRGPTRTGGPTAADGGTTTTQRTTTQPSTTQSTEPTQATESTEPSSSTAPSSTGGESSGAPGDDDSGGETGDKTSGGDNGYSGGGADDGGGSGASTSDTGALSELSGGGA